MSAALGLLPAAVLASWCWALRGRALPWRDALLVSVALGAGWVVLGSECLSAAGALAPGPVVAWWVVGLGGCVALRRLRRRHDSEPVSAPPQPGAPPTRGDAVEAIALALAIGGLMAWAATQSLLAPPNNADVQAYHLPRQVYWLQQGSLAHFPTSVLRQLVTPPFSEMVGVHLLAASGGDVWHNLVQWAALGLLALVVSAFVEHDGGQRLTALWAVLATVSIPPAFVEASSAKNDVLVALWLALVAYWAVFPPAGFRALPAPARGGLLGLALGALWLTKGTGILFGAPVLGLAAWTHGRRAARPLLLAVSVAALLNAPHWVRNTAAFGGPLGPDAATHGEGLVNELRTPAGVASNLVRTLAPHLVTPWSGWNAALESAVLRIHGWLGLSPNDPRTTYRLPPFQGIRWLQFSEDTATAPGHVFLLLLLLVPGLRRRGGPVSLRLLGLAGAGFVLFCASLKWQFWHPRLLSPLLALCVPALAWSWGSSRARRVFATAVLAVFLVPSLNTIQRPLIGPHSLFAAGRASALLYALPGQIPAFVEVARVAHTRSPRVVGFQTPTSSREYAFEWLLSRAVQPPPRFTSFDATFVPAGAVEPDPDLVISETAPFAVVPHTGTGRLYAVFARAGTFSLLAPWALADAVAAADVVVVGELVSAAPLDDRHLSGAIRVEDVLRGPGLESLTLVSGDAASTAPLHAVGFAVGRRGVWLLSGVGGGAFVAPTAAHVRPIAELEAIRELVGGRDDTRAPNVPAAGDPNRGRVRP